MPDALKAVPKLQWSPSLQQFRDPASGAVYGADGKAPTAATPPKAEPAKPFAAPGPAARAPAAGPAAGGYPVPPEHANDPDGTTYNGGKFVKRGDKIVPKIVPGD